MLPIIFTLIYALQMQINVNRRDDTHNQYNESESFRNVNGRKQRTPYV